MNTRNPSHISGIHNYCDRWCERCPFTSRCAVFAMGQEDDGDPASHDISNAKFWKRLEKIFSATLAAAREMAREQGLDPDNLPEESDEEYSARQKSREDAVESHPLCRVSFIYAEKVDAWFEHEAERFFHCKEDELQTQARLELPGTDPHGEAQRLNDAVDIIRWYQFQMHVKLARAVGGREEGVPDVIADMPKDWDGSAKVALIGVERSIAAWGLLLNHGPEHEDEILPFLVTLQRMTRMTDKNFPDARNFIRPGFDQSRA